MAGCLAAIKYPTATILEQSDEPKVNHHALLRMRSLTVSFMTNIPFKEVFVEKFIYDHRSGNCHSNPSPADIINYSRKTNGLVTRRSIADLRTVRRYVPPHDFQEQLIDRVKDRITFGNRIVCIKNGKIVTDYYTWDNDDGFIISTLPMQVNLEATGTVHDIDFELRSRPIYVNKVKLKDYNLNMTIYFPQLNLNVYRASMIGNILATESIAPIEQNDIDFVCEAFSIPSYDIITEVLLENEMQHNGKIQPVDDDTRKSFLYNMTLSHNLYSLGRFACWRQIILDDVVRDIEQIERMMRTHPYDRSL